MTEEYGVSYLVGERVCKNERGTDAGPMQKGGSSAQRRLREGIMENGASGT